MTCRLTSVAQKSKKYFLLLVFFTAALQPVFAQSDKTTDSLLNVLKSAKEDTNKVQSLINLSYRLLKKYKYAESRKYSDEAFALAEKLDFKRGIATIYNIRGKINISQSNFPDAIKDNLSSIKIYKEIGYGALHEPYLNLGETYYFMSNYGEALKYYKEALHLHGPKKDNWTAQAYTGIGLVYHELGNYTEALKNHLICLEMSEEIGYKLGIAQASGNMADIYLQQGKPSEALKNYFAALKIAEEAGNKFGMAVCNTSIGIVYLNQHKYPEALVHQIAAQKLWEEIGDKNGIGDSYYQIGKVYGSQGNYREALSYYNTSLKICEEVGYNVGIARASNNIGMAYFRLSMYPDARQHLLRGLTVSREIGSKESIAEAYHAMSFLDSATGNHKQALVHYKLYTDYKDSMLNESNNRQIAQMKEQYESEKKDKEIALLNKEKAIQALETKKQKQTKNYFVAGLILFAILSFFVYRNYRTRQQLKLQTLRNKIASDLHDDVGSTLSSISIFSQMAQSQSKEVIPALETIHESSRKMLDAMADIVWTINPENDQFEQIIMRMRSFAFELLGARQIHFEFDADDEVAKYKLSMDARKNLYLIFKEATNNMVKYANASKAVFAIKGEGEKLTMMIKDNGKGFDAAQQFSGNGLKNMKKRAMEIGGQLIIDSIPGIGTTIKFELAV